MGIKGLFSLTNIKEKLKQYRRVISIARKPDKEEFTSSAKITGLGILLIGFMGFIIFLAYYFITNIGG